MSVGATAVVGVGCYCSPRPVVSVGATVVGSVGCYCNTRPVVSVGVTAVQGSCQCGCYCSCQCVTAVQGQLSVCVLQSKASCQGGWVLLQLSVFVLQKHPTLTNGLGIKPLHDQKCLDDSREKLDLNSDTRSN